MVGNDDGSDTEFAVEPIRRAPVLRRLQEGPAPRAELQETLDVSKATLHRIVRGFVDDGLVAETEAGVELTSAGRVTANTVETYLDRMHATRRLIPLLNRLPPAVELDVGAFADAEIVTPIGGQPQRPVQRVIDFVETAGSLRGTGAMVLPIYVEVLTREITAGMETELVVAPAVIEALREQYLEQFAEARDSGNLTLLVNDDIRVGVALDGERALVVGTEAGVAQVAVVTDRPAAVEWARAAYDRIRAAGSPYDPEE